LATNNCSGDGDTKVKRKKLKGKRAVVRWLKFFKWKKKKDYERMTSEEKILYKLRKVSPFYFFLFSFSLFIVQKNSFPTCSVYYYVYILWIREI
jgi:hypothetical protein